MINCGVYQITNTITGDFYIGSSVNLRKRLAGHRRTLANNKHCNAHLQNSYNKYGENSFEFSILEQCEKEQLVEREQFYIDHEKPVYNIAPIAGNCLGVKHTVAAIANMSAAQKGENNPMFGKHHTSEACKRMSEALKGKRKGALNPNFGKHHSEASIALMSGRVISDATREKMSAAQKGNTNALGCTRTEESKRKNSEAHIGKVMSEETRALVSESLKGNTNLLGYKHTAEALLKMSDAQKRAWAKRKATMQPRLEAA